MGTDIHAGLEYKENGQWKAVMFPNPNAGKWEGEGELTSKIDIDRDYRLFSILADVRNGYAFAGCDTGDGFTYIAKDRGLPDDITTEARETACTGDHSETWVSLQELLAFDWKQIATLRGVVDAVQFEKWDRMRRWKPQPEEWCGYTMGQGIVYISEEDMREHVKGIMGDARGKKHEEMLQILKGQNEYGAKVLRYCRISWKLSYAECAKQLWTKVLPHALPLGVAHGFENVRLVMNFDS